jgi:hypothetical protein
METETLVCLSKNYNPAKLFSLLFFKITLCESAQVAWSGYSSEFETPLTHIWNKKKERDRNPMALQSLRSAPKSRVLSSVMYAPPFPGKRTKIKKPSADAMLSKRRRKTSLEPVHGVEEHQKIPRSRHELGDHRSI